MTVGATVAAGDARMLAAREWALTARPGGGVPGLQEAQERQQEISALANELYVAVGRWLYEYGRVLKAMYGYEWERGEPAESNEDLLAAEAAYFETLDRIAAAAVASALVRP